MPDNWQNQSNAASISSNGPVDNIEEGMWKLKIESKEGHREEEKEDGGQSKQYPDRPGEPDCGYYLRTGLCGYGSNCRFNHPSLPLKTAQNRSELPQREGQPDCGYYLKTGTCKYGSTCKYHHPLERRSVEQVPLNSLGLPMRQEEKPCPYYMRTYTCKFGPTCKFNHPQPASIETALPASGPAAVGTMGSILPSAGIPYVGALPAWSLTRSSYLPSSRVPSPHAYMPLVFPPLQGSIGAQTWNDYMQGNLNPISASGVMGTNFMYNTAKNQGELVASGQVDLLAMTLSQLPERPDRPECRYFMNTGSCKYGSNCKFHHPKERFAQLATNSLGPHGLPLRPGEDVCTYFSTYGLCKYGPTCKFNHPFPGFYSSYYIGMSPMPMFDQSFFPNPRNSVISYSSEASQSKSSKITDWIQKPENVEDRNNHHTPEAKVVEESPEPVDNAAPNSSELPQDQQE